jgi:U3 small nucleolar RNA-associated protein 10
MTSLVKSITKKVPAKVLLPNLIEIWPRAASSQNLVRGSFERVVDAPLNRFQDHITAYSEFLARTLRHAPRALVLEQVRSLSNIFLQALDIVKTPDSTVGKV